MNSDKLGYAEIKTLMFKLGWPAALNFIVINIYNLTDVIFVGRWLGSIHIASVVIVGTIITVFVSLGLAIGIGGGSMIARALGEKNKEKASLILSNQTMMVTMLGVLITTAALAIPEFFLRLFGANGEIYQSAADYYRILMIGIPFFSLSMMGNIVIHTQGRAKVAMLNSLIPTIINIIFNPVFIKVFNMGIEGAALATLIGYILGFLLVLRFFLSGSSEVTFNASHLKLQYPLLKEIGQIGASVFVNIIATNVFFVLVNQIIFKYNQETGVIVFSILYRLNMLFAIPVISIDSGVRPIVGYNYGSRQMGRVRSVIQTGIRYGLIISFTIMIVIFLSADYIVHAFTNDTLVIAEAPGAMRVVFLLAPLFVIQVITEAYFQAIGRPRPSFYLIFFRNVVVLIPSLLLLSHYFGYEGILYTFPLVELISTIPAIWLLKNDLGLRLSREVLAPQVSSVND